jgi:hypothetical protein
LTYREAAELTWPQLLHAMGVEPIMDRDAAEKQIAAKQDQIFDRIVARRKCLPIDLWRLPVGDLVREAQEETGGAAGEAEVLLRGLKRYCDSESRVKR